MRIALDVPPGLVSDDTTFSSTGRYEDAANMRFWRGRPQTIGGWDAVTAGAAAGKCRGLISWADTAGNVTLGLGTHSKLYVYQGGTLADITPAGLSAGNEDGVSGPGFGADSYGTGTYGSPRSNYYPRTWALDTYGQTLIANPRLGNIYQWTNNTAAVAARVLNSPASVTYALVMFTRQIMALGCNEEVSGTFNPMCIRFSDIETITTWTTTSPNNAGEVILEGGVRIVAGRRFGSGVAVWTDNSVYFGQYTGDTSDPWRFDRIEENSGLIGPNAVAVVGQTAYWIAPDKQFRVWPLGGTPEIITCPIRSDFADNLAEAQGDKIYAASVSSFGEVWWHYPDSRDGVENSRSLFVSTVDGSWSRGNFGRTAAIDAGVIGYPIMVSASGQIFYHELGGTANGAALDWSIKTADQYIQDGGEQFMIRSIYPDFEDQVGAVSLTVHTRKYPQATAKTHGPFVLAEGRGKKDFRSTGAVFALKFSGNSNPSYVRMGKPIFDAAPRGTR